MARKKIMAAIINGEMAAKYRNNGEMAAWRKMASAAKMAIIISVNENMAWRNNINNGNNGSMAKAMAKIIISGVAAS